MTESERSGHPHLHVRQDGSDLKKTPPNDSNKQTDHSLAFLMETAHCDSRVTVLGYTSISSQFSTLWI